MKNLKIYLIKRIINAAIPLLVIFGFSNNTNAQYTPTLEIGRSWNVSGFHAAINQRHVSKIVITGTTVYENQEYYVLQSHVNGILDMDTVAFMREDTISGEMWYRLYNPSFYPEVYEEHLLANYSLNVGDTLLYDLILYQNIAGDGFGSVNQIEFIVEETGTIEGRRYVQLNNLDPGIQWDYLNHFGSSSSVMAMESFPLQFIEGVGPTFGPLFPFADQVYYANDPYLLCMYQEEDLIWDNPNVLNCDIDDWGDLQLSINKNISIENFSVFPNPATGTIKLQISQNESIENIEIYDVSGREVLAEKNPALDRQIDISSLKSGIYLIKSTLKNKKVLQGKFVVNN